jgi:hypothetical protein
MKPLVYVKSTRMKYSIYSAVSLLQRDFELVCSKIYVLLQFVTDFCAITLKHNFFIDNVENTP